MNFKNIKFTLCALIAATTLSQPLMAASLSQSWEWTKEVGNSPKRVAAALGMVSFVYLAGFKDEPDANPMGVTEGFKGFVTKNPFTSPKQYLEHIAKFIDDVIVGYAGKRRGFRVLTEKITYEGKPVSLAAQKQKIMKDGEKVSLYTAPNAGPYGLMGTLWYHIKPATDGLGQLKKATEAVQWSHDVVVNNVN